MSGDQIPGAHWWKVDFHAHSPASFDFGGLEGQTVQGPKPSTTDWLLSYMRAGVDAIVVADHNTHSGIDEARSAFANLREDNHPDFRELVIFPGVEVTTAGAYHLIAVFDVNVASDVINGVLHKCDFDGTRGTSDATTSKSFQDVLAIIAAEGGLAIPAHADGPAGLFKMDDRDIAAIHQQGCVVAIEMVGGDLAKATARNWIPLLGSDAHHLDGAGAPDPVTAKFPGSHFSWVKMGKPDLAGIRVALSDGQSSIHRSIDRPDDPNSFTHPVVRSVRVRRDGQEFNLELSPWLNAIIGGRGTGKSTVVEFIRLALGRFGELPERLKADLDWFSPAKSATAYGRAWDSTTQIEVEYARLGVVYRIRWDGSDPTSSQIEELTENGGVAQEGNTAERFPVLINSQKQIYEMASDPQSLLGLIDQQASVDFANWQQQHDALALQYRTQRAEIDEFRTRISEEGRLRGNLADAETLVGRLSQLRDSPEARELDALREVDSRAGTYEEAAVQLEGRVSTALKDYEDGVSGVDAPDLAWAPEVQRKEAVDSATERLAGIVTDLAASRTALAAARAAGDPRASRLSELREALQTEDPEAPTETGSLLPESEDPYELAVGRRDRLRGDLDRIEREKTKLSELETAAADTLAKVRASRALLTQRRTSAVEALTSSDFRLRIFAQADRGGLESGLRRLTQRANSFDSLFGTDGLQTLLDNPFDPKKYLPSIDQLKSLLKEIHADGKDAPKLSSYAGTTIDSRFIQHLQGLDAEPFVTAVDLWFPEDKLQVLYKQEGGGNLKPLDEGSPGQKTAALLALVLQLGSQPLILDQPEDDLDNRLIYDLVVSTLKRVKTGRQVIVVTHNANVVVNADAELVTVLEHGAVPVVDLTGAIQESALRDAICWIMEGGETAFQVRYRRLIGPNLN